MATTTDTTPHSNSNSNSPLNSTFPVLVPHLPELHFTEADFNSHLTAVFPPKSAPSPKAVVPSQPEDPVNKLVAALAFSDNAHHDNTTLAQYGNRGLTENGDVTFLNSGDDLVTLFYNLDGEDFPEMPAFLQDAWAVDPLVTLKIIFNCRSIHLGKSEHYSAYQAFGWLYRHHPLTFLQNLQWLVRPVIARATSNNKVVQKKDNPLKLGSDEDAAIKPDTDEDDGFVAVEQESPEDDPVIVNPETGNAEIEDNDAVDTPPELSPRNALSHGYWKDLVNILVLAARGLYSQDDSDAPNDIPHNHKSKATIPPKLTLRSALLHQGRSIKTSLPTRTASQVLNDRNSVRAGLHATLIDQLESSKIFRALYVTVARLFADQLRTDSELLASSNPADHKKISLAAKWAPTSFLFHDRYTCVVTSIADILFPISDLQASSPETLSREQLTRQSRELYRWKILSPLRKYLTIVERNLCAGTLDKIHYDRLPSVALARYSAIFARKDPTRFEQYVHAVAAGEARISGAILSPGELVKQALDLHDVHHKKGSSKPKKGPPYWMTKHILQGQWKAIVKRIQESGTLQSALAVCDVSGSMLQKQLENGTTPLHHAIGLSLLMSEVSPPPFGGKVITFSETPTFMTVGGPTDSRDFVDKIAYMANGDWDMNTNFEAVFNDLILKTAVKHEVPVEDMVKTCFVFSDMQFDSAAVSYSDRNPPTWSTSYERICKAYKKAEYPIPNLVFWNLAGESMYAAARDPKATPVEANQVGTALVSGFSQGMVKIFLEDGGFPSDKLAELNDAEEGKKEEIGKDDESEEEKEEEKKSPVRDKLTPLNIVLKAVSHLAYSNLAVCD